MRSLATNALKVVNSKDTLREVVETCKESPLLVNACSQSADFWKDTLTRLHGTVGTQMILQRGDLITGAEWQLFCEGLVKGFAFRYVLNEDGIVKPRYAGRFDGDEWSYDFTIDGVLPLPGTDAIWVEIEVEDYNGMEKIAAAVFFAPTSSECVINVSQFITNKTMSIESDPKVEIEVKGIFTKFPLIEQEDEEKMMEGLRDAIVYAMPESRQFSVNQHDGGSYQIQVKHFIFQ